MTLAFRHLSRRHPAHRILLCATLAACLAAGGAAPRAQTDLDGFMKQVLAERDANWRKLQQYVLDEREDVDMRAPSGAALWGERREYTWFLRDGFFVRSPLRVNGTPVGEPDRVAYEQAYLSRAQERDARAAASGASPGAADGTAAAPGAPPADQNLDSAIRQTRQPQFISSAYFLRFRFDEGRYAFVGREQLEGREVLRIEYYPEKLFTPEARRERRDARDQRDGPRGPAGRVRDSDAARSLDTELMRLMNKSSKVTLWVEPTAHQILKYTFDDLGWNFFPGQWLAQMDGVTATMEMGQAFPDVWLPRRVDMRIGMLMALGRIELRYALQYDHYRQADVQSTIHVPTP